VVPRLLGSVGWESKFANFERYPILLPFIQLSIDFARHQVIELPLLSPELFIRVGIKPPKGVLLYGPPGTGKTLLARAVAATLQTNFLKVVSSAIVDKYIGESARVVREMFGYARDHEPCVIFMDEIDAIGGRRFSEGTSADREIQRTLMEVSGRVTSKCMVFDKYNLNLVAQSNGRLRLTGTDKTHYGYKST
jgi:ATP-dependent protease HslVU (ClpYQ) ATPase subunit